jgi:hypothetical protein
VSQLAVCLESEHLPALTQIPVSLGGQSRFGNNDKGRHLQANRARTAWRIVHLDGAKTGSGLFVDRDFAKVYAAERGWSVIDD